MPALQIYKKCISSILSIQTKIINKVFANIPICHSEVEVLIHPRSPENYAAGGGVGITEPKARKPLIPSAVQVMETGTPSGD